MKIKEIQSSDSETLDVILNKFDQLIAAVLEQKLTPKIQPEKVLWNTADISEYLGVSYKYTSEYVVTHHTFPDAMRVPRKSGKRGHPRWYAGEVIEWIASNKA